MHSTEEDDTLAH